MDRSNTNNNSRDNLTGSLDGMYDMGFQDTRYPAATTWWSSLSQAAKIALVSVGASLVIAAVVVPSVLLTASSAPITTGPTTRPVVAPTTAASVQPVITIPFTTVSSVISSPTPTVDPNAPPESEVPREFGILEGFDYPNANTWLTYQNTDANACQSLCKVGCDFYTVDSANQVCRLKYADKYAHTNLYFHGQTTSLSITGNLDQGRLHLSTTAQSEADCWSKCTAQCHYAVFVDLITNNPTVPGGECKLYMFHPTSNYILGFVKNPSLQPLAMGKFDVIGSSGVVAINAHLMPSGKVFFTARPESARGGSNPETSTQLFPSGEINTLFDPKTRMFITNHVSDNVFCNGAILAADGRLFVAGGDDGGNAPEFLMQNGLYKQRYYDEKTNVMSYVSREMIKPRWYPSPARLVNGSYFIFGASTDGASGIANFDFDVYNPNLDYNVLIPIWVLGFTGQANYPFITMVPHTGDIFVMAYQSWEIVSRVTGQPVVLSDADRCVGIRGGDYPGGTVLLGLHPESNYQGEVLFANGVDNVVDEIGTTLVARLKIDGTYRSWEYDTDRMPYGRIIGNAVLQPNGKVIMINGARIGKTGATQIGRPLQRAAAMDCFLYDPYAPDGQGKRWKILATSRIQRLYHSTALLLDDGTVLVSGSDQVTPDPRTAYEHRVEIFTPPWLLPPQAKPRPVIALTPEGCVAYGSNITVKYTGTVTKASLMTPGANTHSVDFTQRLMFFEILTKTSDTLSLRAPPNPTIMLQGFHMLFLLNDDTPSIAKWIKMCD